MTHAPHPTVLGSGPGLILAHGAGSDIDDSFGTVLGSLSQRHTVVGADYPDVAETQSPVTLDLLADHIVATADAAGLATFAVSGFSMGSAVAVRAYTRYPDRVRALVLSAGLAVTSSRVRLVAETWRALMRSGDTGALAGYLSLLVNSRTWLEGRTSEQVREQVRLFVQGAPPGTEAQVELLGRIDVREELSSVAVPTLVVSPTEDLVLTPADHRVLAEGIEGAELVTIHSGHALAIECADDWADLTTRFLADVLG